MPKPGYHLETPLECLIVAHYQDVFHKNPWDRPRVRRLCDLLQISERELARFLRIAPASMVRFGDSNRYPPVVELLLELVERHFHRLIYGDNHAKPLFPDLT